MKLWEVATVILLVICNSSVGDSCSPNVNTKTLSSVLFNNTLVINQVTKGSVDIEPGDVLCPSTKLDSPLKINRISIGLVGCEVDPLIAFLAEEDVLRSNCSTNLDSCPVPEYLIILLNSLSNLNNDASILPYHQICLKSVLTSSIPDFTILTSALYERSITQSDVTIVVDMFWSAISSYIHAALLPFAIPVLSFASSGRFHDLNVKTINRMLQGLETEDNRNQLNIEQIRTVSNKYLFTMAPERDAVVQLLDHLAIEFKWRTVGLVTMDNDILPAAHTIRTRHTSFVVVSYTVGNLLQDFKPFIEQEIQVFIFYGYARLYLRLLYEAAKNKFVTSKTVWIYPYFDVIFPDNYADIWCEFTDQEVHVIKSALSGTLLVGLSKGTGERYDHFITRFPLLARKVSQLCSDECHQPRFLHTFYLHDTIAVLASALNKVVKQTASSLGISEEEVQLSRNDSGLLVEKLRETELSESVTGQILFTDQGRRNASLFDIRNFVPTENGNFAEDTAKLESPWVLERRATVTKVKGIATFTYYTSEGGNISRTSTIYFADNTTTIPSDRLIHLYRREPVEELSISGALIFIFLLSGVIFLFSIYYADQAALQLESSGIYSPSDLTYTYGNTVGIYGKVAGYLQNVSALTRQEQVAKLKKEGQFVWLSPGKFTRSLITRNIYLEIKRLRTMAHPNVASFYGCLVGDAKSAFLYAHGSRGTLEDVLNNKGLELDWIFSLSFGLDAAEGMAYLHNKRIIHGRLTTATCVITEKWALQIKDYGLKHLHKRLDIYSEMTSRIAEKKLKKSRNVPPEIRFFGGKPTFETDVYTYGLILEKLAKKSWTTLEVFFKKSLLGSSNTQQGQNNAQADYYDEYIAPKMMKIVSKCIDATPYKRPTSDWVATNLRQVSHLFEKKDQDSISMLQIYSRRLEERLGDMGDMMMTERDYSNDIIRSYIPEFMIMSEETGKLQQLQKIKKVVLCIEITNSEFLITKLDSKDFDRIVVLLQKTVEGVLNNFNMNQLHTSGVAWTITSVDGASVKALHNAICAARSLFDNLKDIPVPGHFDVYLTARAGLHAGDIFCGIVEQPIPKVVCFGANISTAVQLMLCSKDGRTLATTQLMQQMEMEEHLITKPHIAMEIDNELMTTVWVEVPHSNISSHSPQLPLQKSKAKVKATGFSRSRTAAPSNTMSRPFSHAGHLTLRARAPSPMAPPPPLRSPIISPSRILFCDHSGNQFSTGKRMASKNNSYY